jgi:hypothetical protein
MPYIAVCLQVAKQEFSAVGGFKELVFNGLIDPKFNISFLRSVVHLNFFLNPGL